MKPIWFILLGLLLLLPGAQPALGAGVQAEELAPTTFWRVGFLLTTPPTAENLENLPATAAMRIRSDLDQADLYYVLPRTTLLKVVEVRLVVFDRSGSSSKPFTASVEVYSLTDGYQRTLSPSAFDLQSAAPNTWKYYLLQGDRMIYPDEVAVVHIHTDPGAEGDLSLGLAVEIKTINGKFSTFLPTILH